MAASGDNPDGFSVPTYHHIHPAPADEPRWDGPPPVQPTRPYEPPAANDPPFANSQSATDTNQQYPAGRPTVTVTRAVVTRSRDLSKLVARKVISASEADGAKESGLTALIWNQVMSYGSDAMITVALAGTVFFSAPSEAQRGNVLLYLLMTMAPFAVVAPIIGPALDRLQHGRRLVMAGTAVGRAVLAVVMALNFTDLYVLFPAALGSLVLSKAYAVIRSAAAPRLVPSGLTLVEANARLTIFGLASAVIGGGIVGVAIKVTGSYPLGLWITAIAFTITAFYALRLPKIVDALPPSERLSRHNSNPGYSDLTESTRPRKQRRSTAAPGPKPTKRARTLGWFGRVGARFVGWSVRGYSRPVVLALQGESTLRWLSGFLTLFLAFYVESVSHGWHAAASLGAVGVATGVGNFGGTAIGTRLKLLRPDLIVLICVAGAAVACVLTAVFFSLALAIGATLIASIANSLGKLSLDAIIQRDVVEDLRSSAFGRSETFLQLSWVLGATVAILLPAGNGALGFIVSAVLTAIVAIIMAIRERAVRRAALRHPANPNPSVHPGSLGP